MSNQETLDESKPAANYSLIKISEEQKEQEQNEFDQLRKQMFKKLDFQEAPAEKWEKKHKNRVVKELEAQNTIKDSEALSRNSMGDSFGPKSSNNRFIPDENDQILEEDDSEGCSSRESD